jgi:hypothetical protein
MTSITSIVPSGTVLGDGVGGYGGELFTSIVGEGLDDISKFLTRVLVARVEGDAKFLLLQVPLCIM